MPRTSFEVEDDKFVIRQVQDDMPIVEANYIERMNSNNGFSKKKLFRKVASIPVVAVTEAERQGYNMSDPADVRRFLQKNPQYRTVRQI